MRIFKTVVGLVVSWTLMFIGGVAVLAASLGFIGFFAFIDMASNGPSSPAETAESLRFSMLMFFGGGMVALVVAVVVEVTRLERYLSLPFEMIEDVGSRFDAWLERVAKKLFSKLRGRPPSTMLY